ncbi:MAG: type II toxin-antitoxin system CcdA family antitoxin [Pseudomonadota bacterium]|nr:type II toxin-antitoxin system CcdA family antitoxin [Pseudomonadota bacterium]
MNAVPKRATNLSINADLLREAKELDINLSAEFEKHLSAVVGQHRAKQWRRDNREAIEAYTRFVEKHGIWNEGTREW